MLLLFLALSLTLAPPAAAANAPWGKKPYGVLLAGRGGGKDWNAFIASLRKKLGKRKPLETVTGTYGSREVQHALSRLEASILRPAPESLGKARVKRRFGPSGRNGRRLDL